MRKLIIGLLMLALISIGLQAAVCKPQAVNSRWYSFTTEINGEPFIDYIQIKTADTCGNVTAVNEYGSLLTGFRRRLADGSWLYTLEIQKQCYYLDEYTFRVPDCLNPNFYWHFGSFQCKSGNLPNCPTCLPLCSVKHKTYFQAMRKGYSPAKPDESEQWEQYRKWLAEYDK